MKIHSIIDTGTISKFRLYVYLYDLFDKLEPISQTLECRARLQRSEITYTLALYFEFESRIEPCMCYFQGYGELDRLVEQGYSAQRSPEGRISRADMRKQIHTEAAR